MKIHIRLLFLVLIAVVPLSGCGYNTIQQNEEAVIAAWGDVEATYQRRADLIPNLVSTVKAYASHEQETFTTVTNARARVGQIQLNVADLDNPAAIAQYQQTQSELSGALSRLLLVAENYPELKAGENFRDLQNQLEGAENRINVARQRYNSTVQTFNSSIRTFPNSLTNKFLLKLERKEPFSADSAAATAPQVNF